MRIPIKALLVLLALSLNLEMNLGHADLKKNTLSNHRLVVYVLTDESKKSPIERSIEQLDWEISDRDILLVNIGEIEIETLHSLSLTSAEKENWRDLLRVGLDESRFVLVGKDGGAKAFQRNELSWQLFFDLIDRMPMRRAEMEATYRAAQRAKAGS